MTDSSTLSAAEARDWLRGRRVACPNKNSGQHHTAWPGGLGRALCPDCEGEGTVPAFPDLERACPCPSIQGADGINHWYDLGGCKRCYILSRGMGGKHDPKCDCRGTGMVAVSVQEAARAVREAIAGGHRCPTTLQSCMACEFGGDTLHYHFMASLGYFRSRYAHATGPDEDTACLRAAVAWEQEREGHEGGG